MLPGCSQATFFQMNEALHLYTALKSEGGCQGGQDADWGSHFESCVWLGLDNKSIIVLLEEKKRNILSVNILLMHINIHQMCSICQIH